MEIDPNKPQNITTNNKKTHFDIIKRLMDENEVLKTRLNVEVLKNIELTKKINKSKEVN